MFIRIETVNRIVPFWNSVSYINMKNVLRVEVGTKKVDFYTVFRPKASAYTVSFETSQQTQAFVAKHFGKKTVKSVPMMQPSPDPLAIAAMQQWEEEKKQLK